MRSLSILHWMIVLVIVVVVFGTRRLRTAGDDLGSAIKNFKSAMREGEADALRQIDQAERTAAEEVRLHPPQDPGRN